MEKNKHLAELAPKAIQAITDILSDEVREEMTGNGFQTDTTVIRPKIGAPYLQIKTPQTSITIDELIAIEEKADAHFTAVTYIDGHLTILMA